ncbi:MAG: hypothetical protein ACKVX7_01950 [Planctomycetota bacterium]
MRRVAVLLAILSSCLVTCVALLIGLSGAGGPLAASLERAWPLGLLKITNAELPRPLFAELQCARWELALAKNLERPWADWSTIATLEDVSWRQDAWLPFLRRPKFGASELRFERGSLRLAKLPFGLNSALLAESQPAGFLRAILSDGAIPERVAGAKLSIELTRKPDVCEQRLELEAPTFSRSAEGVELSAGLTAANWRDGRLSWQAARTKDGAPAQTWLVHFGDADFANFPFDLLREACGMPWPLPVFQGIGRFDLDWRGDANGSVVDVQHYQSALAFGFLPQTLSHVSGRLTASDTHVDWTIERGTCAELALTAELAVDARRLRLSGAARLDGLLDAVSFGELLPEFWSLLLQILAVNGRCELKLELDGSYVGTYGSLVRRAILNFRDVETLDSTYGEYLTGTIDFSPTSVAGRWQIAAECGALRICGLDMSPGRWEGELHARGLRLERRSGDKPRVALEVRYAGDPKDAQALITRLEIRDASLPDEVGSPAGAGRVDVIVDGTWNEQQGYACRAAVSWRHASLPTVINLVDGESIEAVEWPGRALVGPIRGRLVALRDAGEPNRLRITEFIAADAVGYWLGLGGEATRNGAWRLLVREVDGRVALDDVERIREITQSPPPGSDYSVEGVDWRFSVVE